MKFKLFKTRQRIEKERREKYCEWHDYFAWHPVHLGYEDGKLKWVWFETVERRGSHCWNNFKNMPDWWDYREKNTEGAKK